MLHRVYRVLGGEFGWGGGGGGRRELLYKSVGGFKGYGVLGGFADEARRCTGLRCKGLGLIVVWGFGVCPG